MTDVPTRSPRLFPVFRAAAATHVGLVRSVNEDAVLERRDIGLFLVADGVGGASAGDWASRQVVETFQEMPALPEPPAFLAEAQRRLEQVNARLVARGAEHDGQLVATTVVVLLVQGWNYTCLWMGDSRAYLLRGGEMTQLTRDHSEMQEMIDAGVMTPDEARNHPRGNVITRALGAGETAEVDRVSGLVHPGDLFLLCTDGLSKMLTDDEIHALLADPDQANLSASLIAGALAAGGHDNVTVVVAKFEGEGLRPPSAEDIAELKYRKYELPELAAKAGDHHGGSNIRTSHRPGAPDIEVGYDEFNPYRDHLSGRNDDPVEIPREQAPSWIVTMMIVSAVTCVVVAGYYLLK